MSFCCHFVPNGGVRVLAVDDAPDVLLLCRLALERWGHQVITATDGERALIAVRTLHPDVVLLDVMMPGMDGVTVVRMLQEQDPDRYVPVVIVSAKSSPGDKVRALEAGAVAYVTKPFSLWELSGLVNDIVDEGPIHRQLRRAAALEYLSSIPPETVEA